MNKKQFIIPAVIIILVAGWGAYQFSFTDNEAGLRIDPKDGMYVIDGTAIALKDGYSEKETAPGSASKIITRYFGNEVRADIDGDGVEDSAFLLTQEGGGSGTFFYVAAFLSIKEGFSGTNAVLLGDRIAPQNTEFRNGMIIVNYAERKPGEPFSAKPSVGVSKYFKIVKSEMKEISPLPDASKGEVGCTPEQRIGSICAQIYKPVCATVKIQCIQAPCFPLPETFPNACEACHSSLEDFTYVPGECENTVN